MLVRVVRDEPNCENTRRAGKASFWFRSLKSCGAWRRRESVVEPGGKTTPTRDEGFRSSVVLLRLFQRQRRSRALSGLVPAGTLPSIRVSSTPERPIRSFYPIAQTRLRVRWTRDDRDRLFGENPKSREGRSWCGRTDAFRIACSSSRTRSRVTGSPGVANMNE